MSCRCKKLRHSPSFLLNQSLFAFQGSRSPFDPRTVRRIRTSIRPVQSASSRYARAFTLHAGPLVSRHIVCGLQAACFGASRLCRVAEHQMLCACRSADRASAAIIECIACDATAMSVHHTCAAMSRVVLSAVFSRQCSGQDAFLRCTRRS